MSDNPLRKKTIAEGPKKKGRRKKSSEDGEESGNITLAYFKPTMIQKVRILNHFKIWNCFLWGTLPDGVGLTEREKRWIDAWKFVQGLGIPNSPKNWKALRKVWTDWKYAYNRKFNAEKQTGSAPVTWNEAEDIIREILAGNRAHHTNVKVRLIHFSKLFFTISKERLFC